MREWRQRVVEEAKSWIQTPYHHCADVKGVGVDCAMILVRVYCDLGLVPVFDPRPYAPQFFLHQGEEIYLNWVSRYCDRVEVAQAGDIALYRLGRCAAHGAIVIDEDYMIHAYLPAGKVQMLERRAPLYHGVLDSLWSPRIAT